VPLGTGRGVPVSIQPRREGSEAAAGYAQRAAEALRTAEAAGDAWGAVEASDMAGVSPMPWGYDEAAFVCELQAGSEPAFDLLVTHYHGAVYGLVYGMLGDAADAADVTQEVFLKAFRGIRSFRGSSSLKTWLYRIAVREALNHRRWSWRHLRQQFSLDADGAGERAFEVRDDAESPFERVAAREVQQVVRQALARVPAVFRSAVILRDLEGLAYEEIAEVLDVSVGTVKSRILRGRHALREILQPLWRTEPAAARAKLAPAPLAGLPPDGLLGGAE